MHVAHCPMAMDGKGADWLQKSEDQIPLVAALFIVENPEQREPKKVLFA